MYKPAAFTEFVN